MRNLSSDHNHAIQQVTALVHIRQRNNTVTKFQLDGIHLQQTVDIFRLPDLLRRSFLAVYLLFVCAVSIVPSIFLATMINTSPNPTNRIVFNSVTNPGIASMAPTRS